MFVGHWAPALVAATRRDAPSLPVLFLGAQLVDWAFFALLLTGAEAMRVTPGISAMNPMDLYHMPWTHSLLGSTAFAVAFAALVFAAGRSKSGAIVAGLVVLSHWFLDLIVHVPDLTIAGQPPKLGLGLWNYPAIEMPLELGITFGALWFYESRRPGRSVSIVALALVLIALQAVNWFGPVAADVTIATSLLAFFAYGLATLVAWWAARTRSFIAQPSR